MHELSAFERQLAVGLEAYAGPRRGIDAITVARTAAFQAPVRRSAPSRFWAVVGEGARVRGRRIGDLGEGRSARPLVVLIGLALITFLAFGALAVGSGLVRLPSVVPPPVPTSSTGPSPQPSSTRTAAPSAPVAAWVAAGSMVEGRVSYTATLLPDGTVLVAGGSSGTRRLASAELYDPVTRSWSATGDMIQARAGHTATLLPDGKVLVAGGSGDGTATYVASAELFDPATGTWTPTGSMKDARLSPTAALLPSGKVLLAGGFDHGMDGLASAELYDPGTGTWATTGAMATVGFGHALLLPDGRVLVVRGASDVGNQLTSTAELYDERSGVWTPTGRMNEARVGLTATLLPSGNVLVAGGRLSGGEDSMVASAEEYDPHRGTWTATGSMREPRFGQTATVLQDGHVLVAGGHTGNDVLSSAELYDPASRSWTATASLIEGLDIGSATLLPDGTVLVTSASVDGSGFAELYEPGTLR